MKIKIDSIGIAIGITMIQIFSIVSILLIYIINSLK